MTSKTKVALLASALLLMPGTALATEVSDQANAVAEQAQQLAAESNALTNAVGFDDAELVDVDANGVAVDRDDRDDDDGFPWGLLGLLGLAGLLGLKRNDDRDRHDRNDHRDTRPIGGTTGTGNDTGTRL